MIKNFSFLATFFCFLNVVLFSCVSPNKNVPQLQNSTHIIKSRIQRNVLTDSQEINKEFSNGPEVISHDMDDFMNYLEHEAATSHNHIGPHSYDSFYNHFNKTSMVKIVNSGTDNDILTLEWDVPNHGIPGYFEISKRDDNGASFEQVAKIRFHGDGTDKKKMSWSDTSMTDFSKINSNIYVTHDTKKLPLRNHFYIVTFEPDNPKLSEIEISEIIEGHLVPRTVDLAFRDILKTLKTVHGPNELTFFQPAVKAGDYSKDSTVDGEEGYDSYGDPLFGYYSRKADPITQSIEYLFNEYQHYGLINLSTTSGFGELNPLKASQWDARTGHSILNGKIGVNGGYDAELDFDNLRLYADQFGFSPISGTVTVTYHKIDGKNTKVLKRIYTAEELSREGYFVDEKKYKVSKDYLKNSIWFNNN